MKVRCSSVHRSIDTLLVLGFPRSARPVAFAGMSCACNKRANFRRHSLSILLRILRCTLSWLLWKVPVGSSQNQLQKIASATGWHVLAHLAGLYGQSSTQVDLGGRAAHHDIELAGLHDRFESEIHQFQVTSRERKVNRLRLASARLRAGV